MKWSKVVFTYDQRDIPEKYIHLGRFLIVFFSLIKNVRVNRVLMDGGGSLSIINIMTLDGMHVLRAMIKPVHKKFYGIGPGMASQSMGQSPC